MNSKEKITQSKYHLKTLGEIEVRTQFGGYSLAVNKVVFAVITRGELYLRACTPIQSFVGAGRMQRLIYNKCGMPISLNYFHVDDLLWQQPDTVLALSKAALECAQRQVQEKKLNRRVKDLPNMRSRLEIMLRQVGICTVQSLCAEGAKNCWLKLRSANKHLGINTLFALEGAISGRHQAALPSNTQKELREWFASNADNYPD